MISLTPSPDQEQVQQVQQLSRMLPEGLRLRSQQIFREGIQLSPVAEYPPTSPPKDRAEMLPSLHQDKFSHSIDVLPWKNKHKPESTKPSKLGATMESLRDVRRNVLRGTTKASSK